MDVATGVNKLFIAMSHTTKDGKPKIVKNCTYPLTASKVVHSIFTDMAVIEVTPHGLLLKEVAPGLTPEEVQASTEPTLIIAKDIKEIDL